MLVEFTPRPGESAEEPVVDVSPDPTRPNGAVGRRGGWAHAVELGSLRGTDPGTLCRLSMAGGEAFSLAFTPAISTFMYAARGELVSGFDLTVPHIRYGGDRHRFDATIEQAGFVQLGVPDAPAMGARFVQLTFGITIDRQLLERAGQAPRGTEINQGEWPC